MVSNHSDELHFPRELVITDIVLICISLLCCYANLFLFVRYSGTMFSKSINKLLCALTFSEMCRYVVELVIWVLSMVDYVRVNTCNFFLGATTSFSAMTSLFLLAYYVQMFRILKYHEQRVWRLWWMYLLVVLFSVVAGLVVGLLERHNYESYYQSADEDGTVPCRTIMAAKGQGFYIPLAVDGLAVLASLGVVFNLAGKRRTVSYECWSFMKLRLFYIVFYFLSVTLFAAAQPVSGPLARKALLGCGFVISYMNGILLLVLFVITEGPYRMLHRWWHNRGVMIRRRERESQQSEGSPLVSPHNSREFAEASRLHFPVSHTKAAFSNASNHDLLVTPEKGQSSNLSDKRRSSTSTLWPPVDFEKETLAGLLCNVVEMPPKRTAACTAFQEGPPRPMDNPGEDEPRKKSPRPPVDGDEFLRRSADADYQYHQRGSA